MSERARSRRVAAVRAAAREAGSPLPAAALALALPALAGLLLLLVLLASGCGAAAEGDAAPAAAREAALPGGPAGEEAGSDALAHDEHAGHEHAEAGPSDLDRPLADLLADTCEHGVPTWRCPECRYEVGFVAVPADLVERGLVRTAAAEPLGFGSQVQLTGEIRFDEGRIAHMGPRVPGLIRRVMVGLGQRAAAGEPLLELDSPELAEAEAAYLTALAEHRLREREHARKVELRKARIASEREFLETEQALESASILVNAGRQKLLRLGIGEAEIAALEREGIAGATGRYLLRAPFAGEVLEMDAVRGEWVEVGSELLLFGDTGNLWLWLDLYEADLAAVARAQAAGGLAAGVTVSAFPGEEFAGRVDLVGRTMDPGTRTVRARVALPNPEGKLRPGMFATARLALAGDEEALAIPATAVLEDEGRAFVFVRHDDESFVRRPVSTGRLAGDRVEVVAGLAPGQVVVADGAFLLKSDVLREKMGEGCAH